MESSKILNDSGLPAWQFDLINQMLNSMHDFYCLPDKFEENKYHLKSILINKCKEINKTLLNDVSDNPPNSKETYTAFVDEINKALHSFDTHLELSYNPQFINEMETGNKIKLSNNSAKFDFSGGPPKEEVEKWNKYEEDNGYDLALVSDADRNSGKIYLKDDVDGLHYEVIGLDKELKKGIIPWDQLPKSFPRNPSDIIQLKGQAKDEFLSTLLEHTSKAEHTPVKNPNFRNFGFVDYMGPSGVIPKNIGYVNISHLIDPQLGAEEKEDKYRMGPNAIKRLHEVMGQLRDKEAIILDLSVTPFGGSPEMVQNIVSFFMPEHTLINTVHDRLHGKEIPYVAISTPFKILDKPVALVVGPNTFSGREEITYDLQQYNTILKESRFTVIGQPTKGGAHPECTFPLVDPASGDINKNLMLHVPYARSINPISGTNWEDQENKGVQPDILVESKDALMVAVNHLEKSLSHKSKMLSTANIASVLTDKPAEMLHHKKIVTDDTAHRPAKQEKAAKEFAPSVEKKKSAVDDFDISYHRPGKSK